MTHEEKLREIAVASGTPVPTGINGKNTGEQVSPNTQARSKFSSQQGFTPKVSIMFELSLSTVTTISLPSSSQQVHLPW